MYFKETEMKHLNQEILEKLNWKVFQTAKKH